MKSVEDSEPFLTFFEVTAFFFSCAAPCKAVDTGSIPVGASTSYRGAYMITATPTRQMPAPIRS